MTVQEEQLRQLKLMNAYLNPGAVLLKFFACAVLFLFVVFGLFGLMARPAASYRTKQFKPVPARYSSVAVRKDPACK